MNNFRDLGLSERITDALTYKLPTEIQKRSIPHLLKGDDLLGIAQTGTGKTAAFALPLIEDKLSKSFEMEACQVRFLIIAPTRELATQINQNIESYSLGSSVTTTVAIGGVSKDIQVEALSKGSDFLIATPGRLLDLIRSKAVILSKLQTLVLDEADMMLDYGFLEDVNEIVSNLPKKRQTVMFSATMPKSISELAQSILINPKRVEIQPESTVAKKVSEKLYYVSEENKNFLLCSLLLPEKVKRVIVFCKAKYSVPIIVDILQKSGISCTEIHSNRSQKERDQAILDFSEGTVKVLVATDIAARGIDVSDVTHVVNYNLPEDSSYYVHRVGRTARAGRGGEAISICTAKELPLLRNLQKKISRKIPLVEKQPFHEVLIPIEPKKRSSRRR